MQAIIALTNLIVDTMKHINFYGVSMWTVLQMMIWFSIVVWPLTLFFLNRISGGDD
ncbi:MAG: hypothetical protein L6Q45_04685 [Anaerolineales bacterium]|nr:hypothetical protein [Anaerolineales bacterium]